MKTWFKNLKNRRGLELEGELKASRPTPSSHLVKSIAARVNPRPANPVRTRSRIAVAGVATAVMVAAVGASGGFSSAASSIAGAAKSVAQSAHATSPGPVPGAPGPNQTVRGGGGPVSAESQYAVAPTITSFAPEQGAPGSSVTVTGTHFTGPSAITEVDLNGEATSFFVSSSTSLTFTVPDDGTSGTIEVTNAADSADSTDSFTVLTAPTDLSANPNEGGAGTPVEIDATSGLLGTTSVKIGGKAASFMVVDDTRIDTSVPTGAKTGAGFAVVTNPVGTGQTAFTVDSSAPTLSSFTPTSGVADGSVLITVKGTNLNTASDLFFSDGSGGSVDAGVIGTPTKTAAQFDVPVGAKTGPITVANETGQATSKTSFVVIGAATVTSFTPTFGKVGTMVKITGTSFTGATHVSFGGQDAGKITVKGDTSITAKVAAGSSTGHIVVTNGNGPGPASAGTFTFLSSAPDATSASPTTGGSGTSVGIGGTNFIGASAVTFNGKTASFTVVDGTHITAIVPTGAKTTGNGIVVSNAVGPDSTPVAFAVKSTAPTITKTNVTAGKVNDHVVITGTNLGTVTDVIFGGGDATGPFVNQSFGSLEVIIPGGSTTGPMVVVNPDGSAATKKAFTIFQTPIVTALSPAYGMSGQTITIFGSHFTGATEVDFNDSGLEAAKPTVVNDNTLKVKVPKTAQTGPVEVKVGTLNGDSGQDSFTIVVKPHLTSDGTGGTHTVARGNTIDINDDTGHSLVGITQVKVGKLNAQWHLNGDNQIVVTIPAGAKTGANQLISVGNAAGTGTWKVTIT